MLQYIFCACPQRGLSLGTTQQAITVRMAMPAPFKSLTVRHDDMCGR
jgi:hypothetical protein